MKNYERKFCFILPPSSFIVSKRANYYARISARMKII
jgi:hypothetical protein